MPTDPVTPTGDDYGALQARLIAAEAAAQAEHADALAAARAEGEAAGAARERERVLALVRAAYAAERDREKRYWLVTTSASAALDVLEQRIERGDVEGA